MNGIKFDKTNRKGTIIAFLGITLLVFLILVSIVGAAEDSYSWVGKGKDLEKLGQYNEAIKVYDKALELNPDNLAAETDKGDALAHLGKYDEAIAVYNKVIKINPINAESLYGRGVALDKLNKPDEAMKSFDEITKSQPLNSLGWLGKGHLLCISGKYDEAVEAYGKAIMFKADISTQQYSDAFSGTGVALDKLNKHEAATKAFDSALQMDPHNSIALKHKNGFI